MSHFVFRITEDVLGGQRLNSDEEFVQWRSSIKHSNRTTVRTENTSLRRFWFWWVRGPALTSLLRWNIKNHGRCCSSSPAQVSPSPPHLSVYWVRPQGEAVGEGGLGGPWLSAAAPVNYSRETNIRADIMLVFLRKRLFFNNCLLKQTKSNSCWIKQQQQQPEEFSVKNVFTILKIFSYSSNILSNYIYFVCFSKHS